MDIDRDIANKLQFCNNRNVNNNLSENDTQDLAPNFRWTNGFKYRFFFSNQSRESNGMAAFKRNVLSFIPSMMHQCLI